MIDKISLYKSFVSVAENKSISAAAKAGFVTQPAISADILALEELLGTKLFFRTNRGMNLTPEGSVLYDYIKGAFSFINSGEEALRDISGLKRGILRIGASDMTLKFFLLDYIEKFCSLYPGIKLAITNNPSPQTISALKSGAIDFGVISESSAEELAASPDIEFIKVREINDIFVCAPTCPLAKDKNVAPSELEKYPVIMLEKHTGTRKYLGTQKGYENFEADIELATSDLIIEFAKRGIGVAAVVKDFAKEAIQNGELCEIDLKYKPSPRAFFLAYLKGLPLTASAKEMIALIEKGVKNDG